MHLDVLLLTIITVVKNNYDDREIISHLSSVERLRVSGMRIGSERVCLVSLVMCEC